MTSREAFEEIVKVCNYYHRQISKVDCESICGYPIKNIEKDLEVLDIKRSIFNKEEHKYVMTEKFKGQKFMLLSLSIRGDNEIDKVKEWLEK